MTYDLIILGSGAAGLTAALYASRGGLKVLVLGSSGGTQSFLIDSLENYPGIFPPINGDEWTENLKKQAISFGATVIEENAVSVDKMGDIFSVKTSKNEYISKTFLLATGAKPKKLNVPGEAEFYGRGVSYCAICDGAFFKGKNITVVGGGDTALSEAEYLSKIANHVEIIHRRKEFRAENIAVKRIRENQKISVRYDSVVKEIVGGEKEKNNGNVNSVIIENVMTKKIETVETDGVFIFVGMEARTELLDFLPKDKQGYIMTDENMMTDIPGLFCAGDVRSKPLRQIVTAASDGAVAAIMAGKFIRHKV